MGFLNVCTQRSWTIIIRLTTMRLTRVKREGCRLLYWDSVTAVAYFTRIRARLSLTLLRFGDDFCLLSKHSVMTVAYFTGIRGQLSLTLLRFGDDCCLLSKHSGTTVTYFTGIRGRLSLTLLAFEDDCGLLFWDSGTTVAHLTGIRGRLLLTLLAFEDDCCIGIRNLPVNGPAPSELGQFYRISIKEQLRWKQQTVLFLSSSLPSSSLHSSEPPLPINACTPY